MSIGVVARKLLWGRAGNQCAYPGCSQELMTVSPGEASEVASEAGLIVGEEAHIRSARRTGPRFDAAFPQTRIDEYGNLLLLCPTHHTMIDKNDGAGYSVDDLVEMKREHESRVKMMMNSTEQRQLELVERTVISLGIWEKKTQLDTWQNLTYGLNGPIPRMRRAELEQLGDLADWLLKKNWSREFPTLVKAFENLRNVITDLFNVLADAMTKPFADDHLDMEQEVKLLREWDPPEYELRRRRDDKKIALICALTIEATKAINFVIEAIATDVDPYYRFDDGYVLMGRGDGVIVSEKIRLEYSQGRIERGKLYPGLNYLERFVDRLVEANPRQHIFGPLFFLLEDGGSEGSTAED